MRPLLTRLSVVVSLLVLVVGAVVGWPLVWPANPDAEVRLVDGHRVGEMTGYITSVDPDDARLKVSSSLFGLRPLSFALADDTRISIGGKQGGIGDLLIDMPVRVAYELEGRTRHARAVELAGRESGVVPAGGPSSDPEPAPVPAEAAATRPPALPPTRTAPRSAPVRDIVERPRAERRSPPRSVADDEKALEAAHAAESRADAVQRARDDAAPDGSGAIDWLLRESRR
jgi:hypothetical protein